MIRDKNLDPNADAFKTVVVLPLSLGASIAGVIQTAFRAPYAGKVASAHVWALSLTDANDDVRIDLRKNTTSILTTTTDPGAADATTAMSLNATTAVFVAGDMLQVYATTGVGDAMVGTVTLVLRPYLGATERQAAKNAGIAITP